MSAFTESGLSDPAFEETMPRNFSNSNMNPGFALAWKHWFLLGFRKFEVFA